RPSAGAEPRFQAADAPAPAAESRAARRRSPGGIQAESIIAGRARAQQRRIWMAVLLVAILVLVGFAVIKAMTGTSKKSASDRPTTPSSGAAVAPTYATSGPGTFSFAGASDQIIGTAGTLHAYHVAAETGTDQDVAEFANAVTTILSNGQSWIAD